MTAALIAVVERYDQTPVCDVASPEGRIALLTTTLATVKQRLAELSAYHEADLRAWGDKGPDGVLGSLLQLEATCEAALCA